MILKQNNFIEPFGQKLGYSFSYLIFTTLGYYLLSFLDKLPNTWSYFHIMGLTFLIVLIGEIIKRSLS